MEQVKNGDTVQVHYTGKLDDGTIFDTSAKREPLEFRLGEGNVIPGFENAVIGMTPGESKTAHIPAAEAYGPHRDEMTIQVNRDQFPEDVEPEVGQQLQVQQADGNRFVVSITEIRGDQITLDGNHPLAGQDLTFDIELVKII